MTEILQSGATLGRYRLMQRIGVGGMAEVFLGVQAGAAGFQREVAIKVLRPGEDDEQLIGSLVVEAQLAAQLGHPNIVQVIDFGVHGEGFFLVMEYLNGWPLENVMRTARKEGVPMPLDVVVDIGLQALDALGVAHEAADGEGTPREVIHRDVKPANMMVLPMGLLKLVDFGIAKAATVESRTMTGMAKGTPSYMAPEQLRGHEVGPSADIYALAVSLFEMAVGKPLFTGESFIDLLARRLRPVGPEDLKFLDDVQPLLTPIIARGLATDPKDRWPDAASMAEALRGVSSVATRQPLKAWLKDLNMEGCRPLTYSGVGIGSDTDAATRPRGNSPVAGTESMVDWDTHGPAVGVAPGELAQDPTDVGLTGDLIAQPDEAEFDREVPPTRAQFIEPNAASAEPEVPPTRAQFVASEVPSPLAEAASSTPEVDEDGASRGTVFQTRVPTSPALSASVPSPEVACDVVEGSTSSSRTLVVMLALLGIGTVLAFTAAGVWLWNLGASDDPGVEVEGAKEIAEPEPASESPDKGPASEPPDKDRAKVASVAPKPVSSTRSRPGKTAQVSQKKLGAGSAELLGGGAPQGAVRGTPGRVLEASRKAPKASPDKEPPLKKEATKQANKPKVESKAEHHEAARPVIRQVTKMVGSPKVEPKGHSAVPKFGDLSVPTGELLRGTTGSLKIEIVGGSGWTYQIGGRGSSSVGRTRSNLAAGPVEVSIFDSAGKLRSSSTIVILPGNTSRCTWRVEGETLRPIKDGSCTQF